MFETNQAALPCPQRAELSYKSVNCCNEATPDRVDDVGWSQRVVVAVSSVTYWPIGLVSGGRGFVIPQSGGHDGCVPQPGTFIRNAKYAMGRLLVLLTFAF